MIFIETVLAVAALCQVTSTNAGYDYVEKKQATCQLNLMRCIQNEMNGKKIDSTVMNNNALSDCVVKRGWDFVENK